jgi:hypothetical protein
MRDDAGIAQAVEVQVKLVRDDTELRRLAGNEKQSCKSWIYSPEVVGKKVITPGKAAGRQLTHCDRVTIEIVNRWPKSVDVTLLYLDSEGGISDAGTARTCEMHSSCLSLFKQLPPQHCRESLSFFSRRNGITSRSLTPSR